MGARARALTFRARPVKVLTAGVAGCAAIVIAACGGGGSTSSSVSPPAREPSSTALLTAMQSSVRQASSVHVAGNLSNNGTPISVDLDLHRNGDVSGTVSQNAAPFQVVGLGNLTYIKATRTFLQEVKAPTSACAVVCGKWLQLTTAEAGQLTGDLSMNSLTAPLTSGQVPALTEAGKVTVHGQSAWVLRASDGSRLDVSTTNQHYPLAASTGGSTHEVVTYSQWNAAPKPVAPPANEVLNLNNLR
jgi:hypothetical protein